MPAQPRATCRATQLLDDGVALRLTRVTLLKGAELTARGRSPVNYMIKNAFIKLDTG